MIRLLVEGIEATYLLKGEFETLSEAYNFVESKVTEMSEGAKVHVVSIQRTYKIKKVAIQEI